MTQQTHSSVFTLEKWKPMWTSQAASFIIFENSKPSKRPSTNALTNRLCYIRTMEYCSATERNERVMSLKGIMLRKEASLKRLHTGWCSEKGPLDMVAMG